MVGAGSDESGGVISRANARTLSVPWAFATSLDMASDSGSFGNPDLDKSGFIQINVIRVCRPCCESAI